MNLKRIITKNTTIGRLSRSLGWSGGPHRLSVLVIDKSFSMDVNDWLPSRLEAAKTRALEYVEASAVDDPDNEVAVIAYDERPELICPLTPCAQRGKIEQQVKSIRSGSSTNIATALTLAKILISRAAITDGTELLVHLLTDGWHNCQFDPRTMAEILKQRGVVIDVVGIGGNPNDVDAQLLNDIASDHPDGGKRYQFIGDPKRLTEHYQRLAGRLTL